MAPCVVGDLKAVKIDAASFAEVNTFHWLSRAEREELAKRLDLLRLKRRARVSVAGKGADQVTW